MLLRRRYDVLFTSNNVAVRALCIAAQRDAKDDSVLRACAVEVVNLLRANVTR